MASPANDLPRYLTLTETAEVLRMHPKTLYVLARRGDIKSVRSSPSKRARYLFTQQNIEDFLARNTDHRR